MSAVGWAAIGLVSALAVGLVVWLLVAARKGHEAKPKLDQAYDELAAMERVAEARGNVPMRVSRLQRLLAKAGYRADPGRVRETDEESR